MTTTTIAAVATPPGRGGVGIIRVSGPKVTAIANELLGCCPLVRQAHFSAFKNADGSAIDEGIALFFAGPNSFTGEDVLELQGHGGPVVMQLLLDRVVSLGAQLARAGEFSERAFLNDKIDLTQAEAVADLIDAQSTNAAQSALKSLQGAFSAKIHPLVEELIKLRLYVEAAIDFPEEEIDFLSDNQVTVGTADLEARLEKLLLEAKQGHLLQQGLTLVLAGRPNAGKSSLLNALAGRDAAIVTNIPGTTRDVLREYISIEGVPLHIVDTAGLRSSDDVIEQEGVKRALQAIQSADRLLLLVDESESGDLEILRQEVTREINHELPITVIHNKIDLSGQKSKIEGDDIYLSAKEGLGLDLLKKYLLQSVGFDQKIESPFTARTRHLEALQRAVDSVKTGRKQLSQHQAGELLAEDLRQAQQALSEITGEFTSDDLLGRIFSSFCIGK